MSNVAKPDQRIRSESGSIEHIISIETKHLRADCYFEEHHRYFFISLKDVDGGELILKPDAYQDLIKVLIPKLDEEIAKRR